MTALKNFFRTLIEIIQDSQQQRAERILRSRAWAE
jgi:hypothetical protein